jgi:hypothetical protein
VGALGHGFNKFAILLLVIYNYLLYSALRFVQDMGSAESRWR